ncbi:ParA family protein [Streptomyces sp. NPDC001691]|uniref:ParA family protein n=1 Tax=Streptomyces sp. NPDC001691 TaxID=3364600 RepID=UPI003698C5E5
MTTKKLPVQVTKRLRPNGRAHPLIIAALLAAGGTAKTTTSTILATILALRGYKVRLFDFDAQCNSSETLCRGPEEYSGPNVWDLITKKKSLEEVTVTGRYRSGYDDKGKPVFKNIPNLYLVPATPELKHADVNLALEQKNFYWLVDLCGAYEDGDREADENEVWLFDLPANYGRLTVTTMVAMEEEDEVLPPLLVTGKEDKALVKLHNELRDMNKDYASRSAPASPTVHHVLLCATPTSRHDALEYSETIERVEARHGDQVLPYVRYSGVVAGQYSKQCTTPISDPKSFPTLDYEAVADALGFPDLESAA